MKKQCKVCGKKLKKGKIYCSKKCYDTRRHKTNIKKFLKFCPICGKGFYTLPSKEKRGKGKFCSRICSSINRHKGKNKKCKVCNKFFYAIPGAIKKGDGKFCSQPCYWKHIQGKNSPTWKGGIAPENVKRFFASRWKKIRLQAIKRDKGQCQICGTFDKLHVHHIVPWRISHDDSFENLITLCISCHGKIERKLDKKNQNKT